MREREQQFLADHLLRLDNLIYTLDRLVTDAFIRSAFTGSAKVITILAVLLLSATAAWSQAPADEVRMPHQLRINGAFWHILDVDKVGSDPHTVARADCKTQLILMRTSSPESMKAEALTHELEHAFTCESGLVHNEKFNNNPKNQDDHRGVYWSANQWHRFMVENAAFIRWVASAGLPDVKLAEGIEGR